ncbi:hypothetical protein [Streptomyces sp. NPDC059080]|uniref:hypothetical protein n=1 Tax=Streptomyces sp. NPDC059080 TaxID=3346718 RepID=UPI00367BDAC7
MRHTRCTNVPEFIEDNDRPGLLWPNLLSPVIWPAQQAGASVTHMAERTGEFIDMPMVTNFTNGGLHHDVLAA